MSEKKSNHKIMVSFVFALFLFAFIAGCAPAAAKPAEESAAPVAPPSTIKIGILTPLTGNNALYGKQVLDAFQMITDLINTANPDYHMALAKEAGLPNLNGAKIELVVADHKGDTAVAVAEAKRLITDEKVVAMTGQFNSAMTKAVAVVTEQYQIPFLTAGTAVTLTDGSSPLEWLFRFGLNDATYIEDTFKFMKMLNDERNAGIKTVAFMSEDTEFGANIVKEEVKFAAQYGFTVVENINYPASSTNLTSEVLRIKNANPDVVIMASYLSDTILFMRTIKEQNYTPKLIIGQRGGFLQTDFFAAVGKDTEYLLSTGGWSADLNTEVTKELKKLYPEKYSNGIPLIEGMVRDGTNVLFLALAINQAGTTENLKLREALRNLKVDMKTLLLPGEGITINQYGQNTSATGVVMQVQNGVYVTVYPSQFKFADAIYPMPKWSER